MKNRNRNLKLIFIPFIIIISLLMLASCGGKGGKKNSSKDITQFSIMGVNGTIGANTVTLTVPYGTDKTSLTPAIAVTGTSVNPGNGVSEDFTSPVTYTVTAADGSKKNYTVTVNEAPSSSKTITAFSILGIDGTVSTNTITVTVPYGTDVTNLSPSVAITGASVNPGSGASCNFTNPVIYTVTAADGSTYDYTVTVNVALNTSKDITAFSILGVYGTIGANTISLTVPYGTDITYLTPAISISGTAVSPDTGADQDFTNPVIYTVTAADGSTKSYTVTVNVALNSSKDITSLSILGVSGTVGTNSVSVTLPHGTSKTALIPSIAITGDSVNPGTGVAQDFTNPVVYTVTASDGTTKGYTVTVNIAPDTSKEMTKFTLLGVDAVIGTGTASITLPYGTDVTSLAPVIVITGVSVTPNSGVAQNFTGPVTYTVTAEDGSTSEYTVTVSLALNTAKEITSFSILGISGSIVSNNITLTVPYGTDMTALTPLIEITGDTVSPNSGAAQDFTGPVTYTVTAADGSTNEYTVTVSVALNSAKNITSFTFKSTYNSSVLIDDCAGTIYGSSISVTVPPLSDVTALVATFTTTGDTVKVGSTVQTSSATADNFTNPVTYTVTAADGTTKNYTVTVTVQTEVITWTQRTASGSPGWQTATMSDDGTRIAISSNSGIYTSSDSGATWQHNPASGTYYGLATSYDGLKLAAGSSSGYIYTSTDGGSSWTQRTSSGSRSWYSIASSSDGTKLAACNYSSGYIYTSTDGGSTWTPRTGPGAKVWSGIASSADGTRLIACVSYGYIYTSTNSGASWTVKTALGSQQWWSCAASADGQKLAAIAYNGDMVTSNDGGTSWTNLGNRGWCAIAMSGDGSRMGACVWNGYVYFSDDGGVTWVQQTSAGYRYWDTISLSYDGSRVVVCDYKGNAWTAE